jgi:hypothetical protein
MRPARSASGPAQFGQPPGPKQFSTRKPAISFSMFSIYPFFTAYTSSTVTVPRPWYATYSSTFWRTRFRTKKGTFFITAPASLLHSISFSFISPSNLDLITFTLQFATNCILDGALKSLISDGFQMAP